MPAAPHSLSISRNYGDYTLSWVNGETYDQIQTQWLGDYSDEYDWFTGDHFLPGDATTDTHYVEAWIAWPIAQEYSKAKSRWGNARNFGKKFLGLEMRVRGHNSGGWSAWAAYRFTLTKPPKITDTTVTWGGTDDPYKTTFHWKGNYSANDTWHSVGVWWQTCLQYMGQAKNWEARQGNGGDTWGDQYNEKEISFTETDTTGVPMRRIVRVCQVGSYDQSEWVELSHVYAIPNAPAIRSVSRIWTNNSRYDRIIWGYDDGNGWHPAEKFTIQRCTGDPTTGWVPSSASWSDIITVNKIESSVITDAPISEYTRETATPEDKCSWLRVVAKHDTYEIPSDPGLVAIGNPAAPTLGSITNSDGSITIPWTVKTKLPDAMTRVIAKTADDSVVLTESSTSPYVWSGAKSGVAYTFGVQAVVKHNGVTYESSVTWGDDAVGLPEIPTNVKVQPIGNDARVFLSWDTPSDVVKNVELSWADHTDAWTSTDSPSSSKCDSAPSSWTIAKLDTNKTWWFKVRFITNNATGNWSDPVSTLLAVTPDTPTPNLSESVIVSGGELNVSWAYSASDDSEQTSAQIMVDGEIYTVSDAVTHYNVDTSTWIGGTNHRVRVRVIGSGGEASAWSDEVTVRCASLPVATLTCDAIEDMDINIGDVTPDGATGSTYDEFNGETAPSTKRSAKVIRSTPFNCTVSYSGEDAEAVLRIVQTSDMTVAQPDETYEYYHSGDVIWSTQVTESGIISVDASLEDRGIYELQFIVVDIIGNVAQASLPFEANWSVKAIQAKDSTVVANKSTLSCTLTPVLPSGGSKTDECDIYRITSDAPELVVGNAEWGSSYLDPYAVYGGVNMGYRFVTKTTNGDVTWVDIFYEMDGHGITIDWLGNQLRLPYNAHYKDDWEKQTTTRRHLGGSVTHYWDAGVVRKGSLTAQKARITDENDILLARDLARYQGVCFVRTTYGVGYPANVSLSIDRTYNSEVIDVTLNCEQDDSDLYMALPV